MRRTLALTIAFFAACSGPGGHQPRPGDTDFTNTEPSGGNGQRGGSTGGGDANGTPAAGGDKNTPAAPSAPNGRTDAVEEADIYRVDGSRLFYFNTYRGLLTFDISDPTNPKQVGRAPVFGYPVEMFVEGNTVYALIRDSLYLTEVNGSLKFNRNNVSQLVTIDVTDPSHPTVLKTLDIIGELQEGVSRKIGDTIYVVSSIPQYYYYWASPDQQPQEQAWVYSYNVSDAKNPVEVQKLQIFQGGGQNTQTTNGSYEDYFEGVTISATSNTLHVVENWQSYSWQSGAANGSGYNCGSYQSYDQARVTVIDISDPSGAIKVQSKFNTFGHLTDQFKHTYIYDNTTGHGYYLGIFARREWSGSDCSGSQFIQNALEAWDITDGANPVKVGFVKFGNQDETVSGTSFDPDRKVAFAVTNRVVDPMYAISFADVTNLKVLSEIDGLAGSVSVFRLIQNNKFLVGIGPDNSSTCTGFGTPQAGWSTNQAVSIIDVQDLSKIRLVQRQCVSVKDAEWVSSQINWNLDQAHKMIGMESDAAANVISVPVSYYTKENATSDWWWYRWQSAVGVMSWDLSKYDPTNPALATDVLVNHGTVLHPLGQVNRSIIFIHPTTGHRTMVNLSDTHISVTDIQDLDNPVPQSIVEVAPYHNSIYRFGDYVVDQVYSDGYYGWTQGESDFRIKKAAVGVEEAAPVANFTVGQVERVVKWKNDLLLFRTLPQDPTNPYPYYYGTQIQMLVVDLNDPTQPKLRGSTNVPADLPWYWWWCGDGFWGGYWWYGDTTRWATTDRGLAFLTWKYDGTTSTQEMVSVDLSNPDAPAVNELPLDSSHDYYGLVNDLSDTNNVWLSEREGGATYTGPNGTSLTDYRYYAQRYQHGAGGLTAAEKINLPGQLLRTWKQSGSRLFLASSYRYDYEQEGQAPNQYWTWEPQPRLQLLAQTSDTRAALQDQREYTDFQLRDMVGDGTHLFLELDRAYWYYAKTNLPYYSETERLVTIDLSNLTLDQKFMGELGTTYAQLMGLKNNRLFVNLESDGILVVDVSKLDQPIGQQFVRTLGWTTTLEFSDNLAFAPAGNFGIYTLDLGLPPAIAQVSQ